MKSRSVVAAAVVVATLIALVTMYQLFGIDSVNRPTPSDTSTEHPEVDTSKYEQIVDYRVDGVEELTLRDGDEVIRFVPDHQGTAVWQMVEPALSGVDAKAVSSWANRFLSIRALPLTQTLAERTPPEQSEEGDGQEDDAYKMAVAALEHPRFSLTWRLTDGTTRELSLSQAEEADDSCYAVFSGESNYWKINYIFKELWRDPLEHLDRSVILTPVYAITDLQLYRQSDGLTLEAKRIGDGDEEDPADEDETAVEADNVTDLSEADETGEPTPEWTRESISPKDDSFSGPHAYNSSSAKYGITLPESLITAGPTTPEPSFLVLGSDDKPSAWSIVRPIQIGANNYTLYALILELTSLEAQSFVEVGPQSLDLYGLGDPTYSFSLIGADVNGQPFTEEVLFGDDASADTIYAWSSRMNAVFICKKDAMQMMDTRLIDLIERRPFQIPLTSVSEIILDLPIGQYDCRVRNNDVTDENVVGSRAMEYFFNGQDADIQDDNGYHYFKQLYRSINSIEASGVDTKPPKGDQFKHSFTIVYRDEGEWRTSVRKVSLMTRDEYTYYIFVDDQYSGLYCSRDVLVSEETGNYGILLSLWKLEERLKDDDSD
ncbi:MAG: DUF4340 domain-containing protein [Fastidiosipilaceae bacterium]